MPLSPTDPAYRAETVPASVAAMRQPLCAAYGQPADAFGAKGNLVHTSGYHRSRRWILESPDSRRGAQDPSVQHALDKGGDEDDVSAFDFTPGEWGSAENRRRMREITGRVHAAAKARDPRLASLREFAGTLDGRTVVTFNCADGSLKGAFDSSHLDHVHGSFWRSRAAADHTGIVDVMLGIEGDDMNDEQDQRLKRIELTLGWFVQGAEKTGLQPGLGAATFPIVPNVLLKAIASKVDIDAAELAAIQAAAEAGVAAAVDDIVAGVLAGLPEGTLTQQDVETAIRSVLGGLDGAVPPPAT